MEDNRKWFWFRPVVNGEKVDGERWFISPDAILEKARAIRERFNESCVCRVMIYEDEQDTKELVAVSDFSKRFVVRDFLESFKGDIVGCADTLSDARRLCRMWCYETDDECDLSIIDTTTGKEVEL